MTNDEFYDKEIAPELARLARLCEKKDMSFIAVVEIDEGDFGRTSLFTEDAHLTMLLLKVLTKADGNMDAFLSGVLRYAKENNIDYGDSVFMKLIAGEWPVAFYRGMVDANKRSHHEPS